jgi:predicted molibdopterin-dependent oxidoreductase YjgC
MGRNVRCGRKDRQMNAKRRKTTAMETKNTIIINGNRLDFQEGDTLLETARKHHIHIPTLCHLDGTTPTGQCRVCVVEIAGTPELVTSCDTPAAAGMVVMTESPKVIAARKETIKKFLSMGNHNCAVRAAHETSWTQYQLKVQAEDNSPELCPAWGDCRLQDLAYHYQVSGSDYSNVQALYPMEMANPFIIRDFSRCILCGRCVKACNEIQVNNAIRFGFEGEKQKIVTGNEDKPLKESDCVFCGECVQACPVGALVPKDARFERHWETKKVRSTCSYCGVGCQIDFHVKDNRIVEITGAEKTAPNYGSLCVKGRFGFNFIHAEDRLTTPLIKENGEFREATWDEALDLTARRLSEIKEQHGADSIGVLTSARVTNEDNYAAMKFTRAVLKTNNIDHCARL